MNRYLITAFSALSLSLGFFAIAKGAPSEPSAVAPSGSPAQDAWLRYRDSLQHQREALLKDPLSKDLISRAQGLYLLQSFETLAFNLVVAPRTQYPALYLQSVYMPFELSWGFPTPDFLYHDAFIDGAHTYRIYGNKRQSYWSTLQVIGALWGDEGSGRDVGFVDFDKITYAPNGDFEIFLGPNPPTDTGGKTWVKLDPNLHRNWVLLREVFYDWKRDKPMDVHIEILDRDPGAPITFGEEELAARIDRGRKFMEKAVEQVQSTYGMFKKDPNAGNETIIRNKFFQPLAASAAYGANPIACYGAMIYDIKPDEALILDVKAPPARFWGIQLGSVWQQAADGFHHMGSINGAQTRLDSDGHARIVVSLQDPGVPNWLDPVGVPVGMADLRWYKAEGCPMPDVTKVRLKELRRHLPKETPVVTAEQRRADLLARRDMSLYRYGQ